MVKNKLYGLIKKAFWKATKRNYILLSPNLLVNNDIPDFAVIKVNSNKRHLPIKYNYHLSSKWNLSYDIRGENEGLLKFSLSTPNEKPFCELEMIVSLPFSLNICLQGDELLANNERIKVVAGVNIPKQSPWLVGKFHFKSSDGKVLERQTGHRINQELSGLSNSSYYEGQVYNNYDEAAASIPAQIFDSIEKYVSTKGRFLDIGCATGLMVEFALNKGFDAEGIDFSEWAVCKANIRTKGRCRVINFDECSASDFDQQYGVITMHSVIEHLKFPEKALKLLHKICLHGGIVYIQTLNADSLMHRVMKSDWGGYTDYTHQSPWITADWLQNKAKEIGFEVLRVKRYHLWNDNIYDDVWNSLNVVFQTYPLDVLLEDEFGDAVEVLLKKTTS